MYFLVYMTERCNLQCAYCEPLQIREGYTTDWKFSLDELVGFLNKDPMLHLQFYGGEPLMRVEMMEKLLERTSPVHVCVQTNGQLLDRISDPLLKKISVLSVSLDGPPEITNRHRGPGVYERAIAQCEKLRARGYEGRIDARMTVSVGEDIEPLVGHFLDDCRFSFNSLYWQLNVLFQGHVWFADRTNVQRWFARQYKPQIDQLVERWVQDLEAHGVLSGIIPFYVPMRLLLTGQRVDGVQCGAGRHMWAIGTDGKIFPCPVMRTLPEFAVGDITSRVPSDMPRGPELGEPCTSCEALGLCGGRCLIAQKRMIWGETGFATVCDATKSMLRALEARQERVQRAMARHALALDPAVGFDYEVIP